MFFLCVQRKGEQYPSLCKGRALCAALKKTGYTIVVALVKLFYFFTRISIIQFYPVYNLILVPELKTEIFLF